MMDSLCRKRKLADSFIPCGNVSLLNGEPERCIFMERLVSFFKYLVPSFLPVICHRNNINLHFIIISEGCIEFIMICAAMIFYHS